MLPLESSTKDGVSKRRIRARVLGPGACLVALVVGVGGCSLTKTDGLAGDALRTDGLDAAHDPDGRSDTSDDGDGGTGDGNAPANTRCPGKGAAMVLVESVAKVAYCIDSTEVTQAQYQEFLDATGGSYGQPAECANNLSLAPVNGCGQHAPTTRGQYPVTCVDWCDARAYCDWAGKRLCGKIGGGPVIGYAAPNEVEWTAACSKNGTRAFPYGTAYVAGACNDKTLDAGIAPVASFTGCEGASTALFDMSGNVREWINACDDGGANRSCVCVGGAFNSTPPATGDPLTTDLSCAPGDSFHPPASSWGDDLGFRCCRDALDAP
ncbi:hypothetical protein AKJ09_11495 [Labilithrix luteola]|uniref:Sulfatase-modifying factor enzyme-like domain-containing protein n=1 Tax=Labilithrix luteola TaxID=1391654 RepID=A0A0K1QGQ1_9BACT|nr:SUMF1/EgtB/PvdO family nonheme iron enzyme [Labilithrix luteola]AKV04832.1 hypothetical protein AKJ09_11495 [Labilithrix luteola]